MDLISIITTLLTLAGVAIVGTIVTIWKRSNIKTDDDLKLYVESGNSQFTLREYKALAILCDSVIASHRITKEFFKKHNISLTHRSEDDVNKFFARPAKDMNIASRLIGMMVKGWSGDQVMHVKWLLRLLCTPMGVLLTDSLTPFVELSIYQRQQILTNMKCSRIPMRRQAFNALVPLIYTLYLVPQEEINPNWMALQYGPSSSGRRGDKMDIRKDTSICADVVIVGCGADGCTTADKLSAAGHKVILLELKEEGKTDADTQQEVIVGDDYNVSINLASSRRLAGQWTTQSSSTPNIGARNKGTIKTIGNVSVHKVTSDNTQSPKAAGVEATYTSHDGTTHKLSIKAQAVVISADSNIDITQLLRCSGLDTSATTLSTSSNSATTTMVIPAIGIFEESPVTGGLPVVHKPSTAVMASALMTHLFKDSLTQKLLLVDLYKVGYIADTQQSLEMSLQALVKAGAKKVGIPVAGLDLVDSQNIDTLIQSLKSFDPKSSNVTMMKITHSPLTTKGQWRDTCTKGETGESNEMSGLYFTSNSCPLLIERYKPSATTHNDDGDNDDDETDDDTDEMDISFPSDTITSSDEELATTATRTTAAKCGYDYPDNK
ncbi:hypothetical protein SAMD00019534_026190 [Acytostelium subglobosum LB1]|uniref:hypothetical protein n=1 Tax=Acytostelium subglobosum LB1 TaxID=1410327 RepID=UPI000644F526|nr:hypothetical protein SAMD00019534_026190 [Acytostelium subglobosum LB1]GAM19444.1 hypothetical protein SAMD00019534_026190 [Acytostelium subglobosum LB1]|eukprot:XP_012757371.1 hypothetical protein SAMD00019534_026190 [Acytostelium subglobosum LB1]